MQPPHRPTRKSSLSLKRPAPFLARARHFASRPRAKVAGLISSAVLVGALAGGIHGVRSLPRFVEENHTQFVKLEQSLKPTDIREAHQLAIKGTSIDQMVEEVVRRREKIESDFAVRQKIEKERGVILEPPWAVSETDNVLARMSPAEAEAHLRKSPLFRRIDTNPERRAEFLARLSEAAKLREAYADYLAGRKSRDASTARSRAITRGIKTGAYTAVPLGVLLTALYYMFRRRTR